MILGENVIFIFRRPLINEYLNQNECFSDKVVFVSLTHHRNMRAVEITGTED